MANFKSLGQAAEGAKRATSRTLRRLFSFSFGNSRQALAASPGPSLPPSPQLSPSPDSSSADNCSESKTALENPEAASKRTAAATGATSSLPTTAFGSGNEDGSTANGTGQLHNRGKDGKPRRKAENTDSTTDNMMAIVRLPPVTPQQHLQVQAQPQQNQQRSQLTGSAADRSSRENGRNKENQPLGSADLSNALGKLSLDGDKPDLETPAPIVEVELSPEVLAERAHHMRFIGEALDMARLALRINETPVGCVLVRQGQIIAKGMNATNVTRNGTRHAEAMALSALLSHPPTHGPRTPCLRPKQKPAVAADDASGASAQSAPHDEGNEDGSKGHLYPYGQKLVPEDRVDPAIIKDCILYVTVEPCVMCASTLRQLGIKKVYFGAVNDKFGGAGGVFSIHANSFPVTSSGPTKSAHPTPRPIQYPDGGGSLGTSYPAGGGDGGNVEPGFEIEGGWGRDEAVALLRRFYVQENGRAPVPRKKEGRAARLPAMMNKDGHADASVTVIDGADDQDDSNGSTKENYKEDDDSDKGSSYGDDEEDDPAEVYL